MLRSLHLRHLFMSATIILLVVSSYYGFRWMVTVDTLKSSTSSRERRCQETLLVAAIRAVFKCLDEKEKVCVVHRVCFLIYIFVSQRLVLNSYGYNNKELSAAFELSAESI